MRSGSGRSGLIKFGIPRQRINGVTFQTIETAAGDDVLLPVLEAGREGLKAGLLPIYVSGNGDSTELFDLTNRVRHRFGGSCVIGTHLADEIEP